MCEDVHFESNCSKPGLATYFLHDYRESLSMSFLIYNIWVMIINNPS